MIVIYYNKWCFTIPSCYHLNILLEKTKLGFNFFEINFLMRTESTVKRPCISHTFSHKIEVKNQGCGLSMDTSVFGVLENLINIHKTS